MRLRRRDVLAAIALGAAATLRPRGFRAAAHADAIRRDWPGPPRYWLNIIPGGGIDAVWTFDPKTRRQVKTGVDVPYEAKAIVEKDRVRLGPHFRDLSRHVGRLSILNGVLVRAANHFTGVEQSTRLRTRTTMRTPAVFEIIGAHRDTQAMAHVCLGSPVRQAHTSGFFGVGAPDWFGGGADVFDLVGEMEPEQLAELSALLDRRVRAVRGRSGLSAQDAQKVDNIAQVQTFFERVARIPRFQPAAWLAEGKGSESAKRIGFETNLQRAVWLLENDLAATVTVATSFAWDTHAANERRQSQLNPMLASLIGALFEQLDSRSNRHGTLADQTAVVIGSEIGRFPYVNASNGKDHFPQSSMIVSGPPFQRGRQFGETGPEMEALPLLASSGAANQNGSRVMLDDIGHTALRIAGIDPDEYGVAGRLLPFLVRGGA